MIQVNKIRVSCSWVSPIESNHTIHFCPKSMHARIQCLSLILTGMSILEHVNMSTYLVSLAPRTSGRRSTLGPRWVIGGSPIFGGHSWVPAEN